MEQFQWLYPPASYTIDGNNLKIVTKEKTDFWQRTDYGFRNDNGHFYYKIINGDFTISAECHFENSNTLFDQCGLYARIDEDNWIKCSTEFDTPEVSHLGAVATNHGYSDWSKQEIPGTRRVVFYKMMRKGQDFKVDYSLNGRDFKEIRVAHLFEATSNMMVGVYACSPQRGGFECEIHNICIQE